MGSEYDITTPIVLIVFKRPERTRQIFEILSFVKPRILYIVADGPSSAIEEDLCRQTRAVVEEIDWDCDVRRNYSDSNMGLKARIASGLDWVFDHEESAIILEDDCVPDITFFRFCEELLDRYRHDDRVMHITGDNFGYQPENTDSYYFTNYAHVWGWATWRRAWQKFDVNMRFWNNSQNQSLILSRFSQNIMRLYWRDKLNRTFAKQIDSWAYIWMATCLLHGGLSAMPRNNLVKNVGAGADATHTKSNRSSFTNRPVIPISFPLDHPDHVTADTDADWNTGRMLLLESTISGRILSRVFTLFERAKLLTLFRKFNLMLKGIRQRGLIGFIRFVLFEGDTDFLGYLVELRGNRARIDGLIISMDADVMPRRNKSQIVQGRFEKAEREAVKKYLDPSIPVIELGGSIGVVACTTNRLLNDPTNHVVVEASPSFAKTLAKNRELNHCQFQIINKALAYDGDTVRLNYHGFSTSIRNVSTNSVEVPTTSLAAILEVYPFEKFTLVCDIEGAELDLIKHESEILRDHAVAIMVELHPTLTDAEEIEQAVEILTKMQFEEVAHYEDTHVYRNKKLTYPDL